MNDSLPSHTAALTDEQRDKDYAGFWPECDEGRSVYGIWCAAWEAARAALAARNPADLGALAERLQAAHRRARSEGEYGATDRDTWLAVARAVLAASPPHTAAPGLAESLILGMARDCGLDPNRISTVLDFAERIQRGAPHTAVQAVPVGWLGLWHNDDGFPGEHFSFTKLEVGADYDQVIPLFAAPVLAEAPTDTRSTSQRLLDAEERFLYPAEKSPAPSSSDTPSGLA